MDLSSIVTPLDVKKFEHYLRQLEYDPVEREFLVDGVTNGFDIGYKGPVNKVKCTTSHLLQMLGTNSICGAK